ncbi:MAG: hypothetical protein ABIJ37_07490 [Pseudomonadota bacterium]
MAKIQLTLDVDSKKGSATLKKFSTGVVDNVKRMSERSVVHIKKMEARFKKMGGALQGIGRKLVNLKTIAVGALVGWGVTRLVGEFERLSATQEQAEAGMLQAMKSMGRYTPELHEQLLNVASSLQKVTTFGDEATIAGMKFLLTYRDITDDLLPRTSATMLDLAALMGGDTKQAANMLGKASMGMTGELRRVGITVDEDVYKMKGFIGVLEQIEMQVKGQARAIADTDSGGLIKFGNAVGDVKEKIGALTTKIKAIVAERLLPFIEKINDRLQAWIKSGEMERWAKKTGEVVINVIAKIVEAIGWIPQAFFNVKGVINIMIAEVAALGSAAVKAVAAILATTNPSEAVKWAVLGFEKTFPTLSKINNYFDKLGASQLYAADQAAQSSVEFEGFSKKLKGVADEIRKLGKAKPVVTTIEQREVKLQTIAGGIDAVYKKETELAIKQAEADKKGLESRLKEFQSFYNSLKGMIERNFELEKKHIEELNALYRQKMDIQKSTEEKIRSLREIGMSEEEKYRSQMAALNEQFRFAMSFSGQEQIKALEEYKQAAASFGQTWSKGVGEGGDVEGRGIVQSAIANIERATKIQKIALEELEQEKKRQIETDRTWGAVLKQSAYEAAKEIKKVEGIIKNLSEQIMAMQKKIGVEVIDKASPMLQRIQSEMAKIKDKTVTVTVKHIGYGSTALPLTEKINQILEMYQQFPTDFSMTADFSSITSGLETMRSLAMQIRSQQGWVQWTGQRGDPTLGRLEQLWDIGRVALLSQLTSGGQSQSGGQVVSEGPKSYYYFRDIVINVPEGDYPQTDEDWRRITRDFIIPEIKSAGQ